LIFVCLFFPWAGTYAPDALTASTPVPSTLSGWSCIFQGLGWLYFLLLVLSIPLAFGHALVPRLGVRLPPQVQQVWPHRLLILVAAVVVMLLCLFFALPAGVADKAVETAQAEAAQKEAAKAKAEGKEPRAGKEETPDPRSVRFGHLTLYYTFWLRLAVLLQVVALIGVLLDYWLARRGARPLPKVEMAW
jgi:hypothetical protein